MTTAYSKCRGPGRPDPTDSATSAEALLDAALACFAEHGIQSTSLRTIAKRGHVTPAMLHYHFGTKDALVNAVVEQRIMPALASIRGAVDGSESDDPSAVVTAFLRAALKLGDTAPWLPPLWVREVLIEGGMLRAVMIERVADVLPRVLANRFAQAQSKGSLNLRLDHRLMVVSLLGLSLFPLAAAPLWRSIFAADDIDSDRLLEHTLALILPGLEPSDER